MTAVATAFRAHSESAQLSSSFPSIIVIGSCSALLRCMLLSKPVSNAIESAMIASSTALMQACKRGAPSARVVSSNKCSAEVQKGSLCQQCKDPLWRSILWTGTSFISEIFSRSSRRACVSCVKVVGLNTRLHKL